MYLLIPRTKSPFGIMNSVFEKSFSLNLYFRNGISPSRDSNRNSRNAILDKGDKSDIQDANVKFLGCVACDSIIQQNWYWYVANWVSLCDI